MLQLANSRTAGKSLPLILVDKLYVSVRPLCRLSPDYAMSEATPEPAADAFAALRQGPSCPVPGFNVPPQEAAGPLDLPGHARGLLKIRVPVQVTLAAQRKPIQEIIELGPGSIVKFDKTCDELLELCIGDQAIAMGEVVKVGDKFGLRVEGLIAPGAGAI